MDEIHVYLSITDFEPAAPSDVTALLGIEPTAAWRKGEAVEGLEGAIRPTDSWRLQDPLPDTAPFEDQLQAMLEILEPRAHQVRAAAERYSAQISCDAYFASFNPGFALSTDHIARIAALGLSMDFDIYCVDQDEDAG